jgi:hypothetical protein
MFAPRLSQLHQALLTKIDFIQRSHKATGEEINRLSRKIVESEGDEQAEYVAEQEALRARRATLATELNDWRDRAKELMGQTSLDALRAYLQDLNDWAGDDDLIRNEIKHAVFLLTATDAELAARIRVRGKTAPFTPAGRLLDRARREYDLRDSVPTLRQKLAIEFANLPSMTEDQAILAEIEDAIYDVDKYVREMALLMLIQIHRQRALRLLDLDAAQHSVQRLSHLNHPQTVPALVNVVEQARAGYTHANGAAEPADGNNQLLRVTALKRLVEWHMPEARRAIEKAQADSDPQVSYIARRALEVFPDEWVRPLRGTGIWV